MRKIVLAATVALYWAAFLFGAAEEQKLPVIMVTDVAGLGGQGAREAAWAGVARAAKEFSLPVDVIESNDPVDYVANLQAAADRAKVVVAVGSGFADSTKRVAPQYPGIHFIQIEGAVADVPNVASYDFKSEEAGFLAGVVAAAYTKTGKVGAVTGLDIPSVEACEAGFLAGVKAVNESAKRKVEPIILSAGTFDDPAKGKSLAESLISRGADVLLPVAGKTGAGVREAVKGAPGVKIIREDADRDALSDRQVLASTLKRVDNAVFQGIQMAVDRTWKGGHRVLGFREGGIGLSEMTHSRELFSAGELAMIERAKHLLGRAEITVPSKRADVDEWSAPDLAATK